jgi:hypothetical protein
MMERHGKLSDTPEMLQVFVLKAKKCRFHAPRGHDATQRVASIMFMPRAPYWRITAS